MSIAQLTQQTQNKIWKLKALMDRGEGGEAENAKDLLLSLLSLHGLSIMDLASEPEVRHEIVWNDTIEKKLIVQVCAMLEMDHFGYSYNKRGARARTIILKDSATKIELFKLNYDALLLDLKASMEAAYLAFIHVNRVFPPEKHSNKEQKTKELTDVEKKAIAMLQGMKRVQIQKRLEK